MLYQQLYEEQDLEAWLETNTYATGGDFPDGSRPLKKQEQENPKELLPKGIGLWSMGMLISQSPSTGEQGEPFTYDGVQYGPVGLENSHWRVDQSGLKHLADSGRLWSNVSGGTTQASASKLYLKIYREEKAGRRLNNIWEQMIRPSGKRYSVETGSLAIERCILMTTRPGDLVLDPTTGGGSTAFAAEKWGRRWITIDCSRMAIAVARERVLVNEYPMHLTLASEEGFRAEQELRAKHGQGPLSRPDGDPADPATGFVYQRVRRVSAATLAYENRPDKPKFSQRKFRSLFDRTVGKEWGRVCSPFTVESELYEIYIDPAAPISKIQRKRNAAFTERVIAELQNTGIKSEISDDSDLHLQAIEVIEPPEDADANFPTHTATLTDHNRRFRKAAVIRVWPEDARLDTHSVQATLDALSKMEFNPQVLIAAAADFDDAYEDFNFGHKVEVVPVKTHPDMHLKGTRGAKRDAIVTLVAEPALEMEETDDGKLILHLRGWNEFNPLSGQCSWGSQDRIKMWLLDTDYDGTQFYARRIHIPKGWGDKSNHGVLKRLLGRDHDRDSVTAAFSYSSHPFARPTNKDGLIAIRVIGPQGTFMSCTAKVDKLLESTRKNRRS